MSAGPPTAAYAQSAGPSRARARSTLIPLTVPERAARRAARPALPRRAAMPARSAGSGAPGWSAPASSESVSARTVSRPLASSGSANLSRTQTSLVATRSASARVEAEVGDLGARAEVAPLSYQGVPDVVVVRDMGLGHDDGVLDLY